MFGELLRKNKCGLEAAAYGFPDGRYQPFAQVIERCQRPIAGLDVETRDAGNAAPTGDGPEPESARSAKACRIQSPGSAGPVRRARDFKIIVWWMDRSTSRREALPGQAFAR
jgi:hypothetical protein